MERYTICIQIESKIKIGNTIWISPSLSHLFGPKKSSIFSVSSWFSYSAHYAEEGSHLEIKKKNPKAKTLTLILRFSRSAKTCQEQEENKIRKDQRLSATKINTFNCALLHSIAYFFHKNKIIWIYDDH